MNRTYAGKIRKIFAYHHPTPQILTYNARSIYNWRLTLITIGFLWTWHFFIEFPYLVTPTFNIALTAPTFFYCVAGIISIFTMICKPCTRSRFSTQNYQTLCDWLTICPSIPSGCHAPVQQHFGDIYSFCREKQKQTWSAFDFPANLHRLATAYFLVIWRSCCTVLLPATSSISDKVSIYKTKLAFFLDVKQPTSPAIYRWMLWNGEV